ncbi:hypothetical protein [Aquitalea sp.]|uniref:hypothetical protein n=1 Tax=Aquitalea sp. TaxID=1872623 RepID=UPI002583CF1B|nr:hypothetical protein [Aquitalea sp.]
MQKKLGLTSQKNQITTVKICNPFIPTGPYRDELLKEINRIGLHLNKRQWNDLLKKKLMLENKDANESTYIQSAVELTVCAWFSRAGHKSFLYEEKINPPKDVDCAFRIGKMQFNIEVKCPNYEKQHSIQSSSDFVMYGQGRLGNYREVYSQLASIFNSGSDPKILGESHHMDLKLKQYLLDANSKFSPSPNADHLNVLVVCVDDQMDMSQWYGYLNGPCGLFVDNSFSPSDEYENVDLVVLSNLYHRHHQVSSKNNIQSHWDFSKAFNILIKNPKSKKSDFLFYIFDRHCPNENEGLSQYWDETSSSGGVRASLIIPEYVARKQFEKGIYSFQGYSTASD